jgi:hypothetical protein
MGFNSAFKGLNKGRNVTRISYNKRKPRERNMTKITEWKLVKFTFFDKTNSNWKQKYLRRDAKISHGMGDTVQNKLNIMRKIQVSAA